MWGFISRLSYYTENVDYFCNLKLTKIVNLKLTKARTLQSIPANQTSRGTWKISLRNTITHTHRLREGLTTFFPCMKRNSYLSVTDNSQRWGWGVQTTQWIANLVQWPTCSYSRSHGSSRSSSENPCCDIPSCWKLRGFILALKAFSLEKFSGPQAADKLHKNV